jgi:hypothetical protein
MRCFWQSLPRVCVLRTHILARCLLWAMVALTLAGTGNVVAQDKPAGVTAGAQVAKAVGVIKSIQSDLITVAAESGGDGDIIAKLTGSTKILRVPPGEKDLKNATALQVQDLQPGDRVLVRGQAAANGDGHTIAALAVIVMKQSDVAAKQQHDRDDWQKRGVGGLVTKVDAAAGTITISSGGISASRSIAIHITKDTILRRYAPDSVKFDDAKPAPVDRVNPGDQLRARGTHSPDGSELTAEEVVSGTFRNIAGTIKAIDAAGNTMTVQDAITKRAVVVKVSSDSQMKKLPAELAQRIAMRLKNAGGAAGGGHGDQVGANGQNASAQSGPPVAGGAGHGQNGGAGGNGASDLQRMLGRLPNRTLADLQKGDVVMIVSTDGADSGAVTAVTLLAGVEAILTAATNRSASTLLSPWSLSASATESEAAQQ